VITNTTPVTTRKDTETELHKSKAIQKGTLFPPPPPPNICALCTEFHAKADRDQSRRAAERKGTENETTSGLDLLRIKKILQGNGNQGRVVRVCPNLVDLVVPTQGIWNCCSELNGLARSIK